MYFELNLETIVPRFSELACWFFTGVCFAATLWYTAEVLRSPHWGNQLEASTEPNSEEEALGYREHEARHSGAEGRNSKDKESGKENEEEESKDGESEVVTEEEMWCPDEESSAEENIPELEDIATTDDKTSKKDQKDTAEDNATITPKASVKNDEDGKEAENGEDPKEGKTTDEEKGSEDCHGFEEKEQQEQKTCPEALKDETGQEEEQEDVAASQKVPEIQAEEGKDDSDKQEKEQQTQPPEAVTEDLTVPAKKTDGATKVLKKKKKKKTRSQPPPSLFSCPFMSSEMMEPTSAETRGSWRRKDRGKPQLHSGKIKAEQPNSLPAIQNGETETERAQDEASSSSNVLDKDEDVENLKKEIYEEACPHRKVYKEAERSMTAADRETERRIQQEQLAAIFKLMQDNEDKFGVQSYGDVEEQMKLYKT